MQFIQQNLEMKAKGQKPFKTMFCGEYYKCMYRCFKDNRIILFFIETGKYYGVYYTAVNVK